MSDITLSLVREDQDLLMTITPREGQPEVNLKKLQTAFKSSQHSNFLLIEGSIETVLAKIYQS